jgi:hypothetical protein
VDEEDAFSPELLQCNLPVIEARETERREERRRRQTSGLRRSRRLVRPDARFERFDPQ